MTTGIDFNESSEYVKEFKIFNNGVAGIVENVRVRVEKKSPEDSEKKPAYRLIIQDDKGEINEGFYYYKSADENGFKNYQAQKLILLAKGALGEDVKFPAFSTPVEALDQIMIMVAKGSKNKLYRAVATYGTTKRPDAFLGLKSFGSFIQDMSLPCTLALDNSDNTIKAEKKAPATEEEVKSFISNIEALDLPNSSELTEDVFGKDGIDDLPF